MSDWERKGWDNICFETNDMRTYKLESMERLRKSGLPQYDWFECSYEEFKGENLELVNFIDKYLDRGEGFCVRALPTKEGGIKGFVRKPRLGFMDFGLMKDFLESKIKDNDEFYRVGLSNWEPSNYGGTIISDSNDAIIEINPEEKGGLRTLSAGKGNFSLGEFKHWGRNARNFKRMHYSTKDIHERKIMWKALQFLRKDLPSDSDTFPNISFISGFFDFVVTGEKDNIRFLDYKTNEAYLKFMTKRNL
ncbi:hypothetical protein GOV13_02020 [Candidatus Pacearchaeota archaeon]|nr:hypothetical protein [Candidatus Pacearchaeota archaeon]